MAAYLFVLIQIYKLFSGFLLFRTPSLQMSDEPEFSIHFVLARTRARQEVFVFSLHLFTCMPQIVVAQRVKGEGFLFLGSQW